MAFPHLSSPSSLAFEAKPRLRLEKPPADRIDDPPRSQRELASAADRLTTQETSLASVWQQLAGGQCKVVDSYFGDQRCYVLTESTGARPLPVPEAALRVLEAVLCEGTQKVVAFDLHVSASTVATKARVALAAIGVEGTPQHVHPLLVFAAVSARGRAPGMNGSVSFVNHRGRQLRVISMPRPDRRLATRLTEAELDVTSRLFEGVSHARIACMRGTSPRTVANQLAAVFKGLAVSGRGELLLYLLTLQPPLCGR
jgi:DNA-binding CsgD family transcriptional regulator